MLCGLIRPTSGHATIVRRRCLAHRYVVRARFGYMAQKFSLYQDLTVLENMRFFAGRLRVAAEHLDARIDQLLGQMDLRQNETPPPAVFGRNAATALARLRACA